VTPNTTSKLPMKKSSCSCHPVLPTPPRPAGGNQSKLQTTAPQRPPRWMTHYRGASATITTRPPTSREEIGRGCAPAPAQATSTGRFTTMTPPHRRTLPPATTAGQRRSNDETTERRRKHQLLIQWAVALGSSSAPAIGVVNGDQETKSDLGPRSDPPHRQKTTRQDRKLNYLSTAVASPPPSPASRGRRRGSGSTRLGKVLATVAGRGRGERHRRWSKPLPFSRRIVKTGAITALPTSSMARSSRRSQHRRRGNLKSRWPTCCYPQHLYFVALWTLQHSGSSAKLLYPEFASRKSSATTTNSQQGRCFQHLSPPNHPFLPELHTVDHPKLPR
jgi:hypothetical protein